MGGGDLVHGEALVVGEKGGAGPTLEEQLELQHLPQPRQLPTRPTEGGGGEGSRVSRVSVMQQ